MNDTIHWERQKNSSVSYRYERDGIRATYGQYEYGSQPHANANDVHDANAEMRSADCCDLLTARVWAEDAIRDLQRLRGETPATPECCHVARSTGDCNEGPGGILSCPTCGRSIARFRQ